MLFVTHDVEEAVYLSDRVVVMSIRPGRIKTAFTVDLARPRHQDMFSTPRIHRAAARGDPHHPRGDR